MRSFPRTRHKAAARLAVLGALVWVLVGDVAAAFGQARVRSPEQSLAEVDYLLRSGVPSSAIRAFVEAEDLRFTLTARDLVALKESGADEKLLLFLLERSRRAGVPVELEGATVIYEAKGVRAFRKKDSKGQEILVVTNLDENGLRLDAPPDLPEPVEPSEPERSEPAREHTTAAERGAGATPAPPPFAPPPSDRPEPAEPPARRGMVYVGPFYQFVPSNVPGPGSPWSPVFQILPTPGCWPFVSVYPFFELAALYPYLPYRAHGFGYAGVSSFRAWGR